MEYEPALSAKAIVGGVTSTLIPDSVTSFVLPATSIAVPDVDWPAPSPNITGLLHDARPDSASPHAKLTTTGALAHPSELASGARAASIEGGVRSSFTVRLRAASL